jgi:hypothetical protein
MKRCLLGKIDATAKNVIKKEKRNSMENKSFQDYADEYQKETGENPRTEKRDWTPQFIQWFCKVMQEENKFNARV